MKADEITRDGDTIPHCPYCEAINYQWAKGPECQEAKRRCRGCGKISNVWYYRVYLITEVTK